MCTFHIENHEPFESLTKNCLQLDKNKSIVSEISISVVRILSRIFYLGEGGGVDPKKHFWSHAAERQNVLGFLGGSGAMLARKILKRQCSGLAEIAFLDIGNLH